MLKTLCILALLATVSFAQDAPPADQPAPAPEPEPLPDVLPVEPSLPAEEPAPVEPAPVTLADPVQAVQDAVDQAGLGDTPVSQAVQDVNSGATAVDVSQLPELNQLNVTWGPRDVILSPADWDAADGNWLNNWENIDIERAAGANAEGEWGWNWSAEDGTKWALWDQDGQIWLVDSVDGTWNQVASLGESGALGPQLAQGAQSVVDGVWNNDQNTVSSQAVGEQVSAAVNSALASGQLNAALNSQGLSTDSSVQQVLDTATQAAEGAAPDQAAVDQALADAQAAADAAAQAPADAAAAVDAALNSVAEPAPAA